MKPKNNLINTLGNPGAVKVRSLALEKACIDDNGNPINPRSIAIDGVYLDDDGNPIEKPN